MLREILAKFTGGQLTAITIAAILVPGVVGAAVAFQPVAIVDPFTGKQSYVDGGRKLWVYDPIAGYRNNPANAVEIYVSNTGTGCETPNQYAVPSGKALVITAMGGFVQQHSTTAAYSGFAILEGTGCSGRFLTRHLASVDSAHKFVPVSSEFGSGIVVKAGKVVSVYSINNFGFTFAYGYLIPATAAPASPAQSAAESGPMTVADIEAKLPDR